MGGVGGGGGGGGGGRGDDATVAFQAGSSLDEQLSALAAAGMSHIDLRSVDGYNITALPYEHARVVAARLKEAGVSVCMFGSPIGAGN
eukprot:SAG11_NODE_195_length_12838_cov_15.711045_1_plen_88_part_00